MASEETKRKTTKPYQGRFLGNDEDYAYYTKLYCYAPKGAVPEVVIRVLPVRFEDTGDIAILGDEFAASVAKNNYETVQHFYEKNPDNKTLAELDEEWTTETELVKISIIREVNGSAHRVPVKDRAGSMLAMETEPPTAASAAGAPKVT